MSTTTTRTAGVSAPPWVVVHPAGPPAERDRLPRLRSVVLLVGAAAVVVIAVVAVVGILVSRRAAERESVRDAAELTNVLADSVVQPALTDQMATSTTAASALDPAIRTRVIAAASVVRVKLWTPQGRILYSDEPRLVGRTFDLDADARATLADPQVRAEVSDLDEPENQYERGRGKLLEVHRPVYTPAGRPLLFEAYLRYDQVTRRSDAIWHGFAAITLGSIGLLVLLLVPLAVTLLLRARRAQRQREAMLRRAADASLDERRRIAATLHDGVVQELVAASLVVGAGAQQAESRGADELAGRLRDARDTVRGSIGGMRSLLVDIYPPNLYDAGLPVALRDLVAGLRPGAAAEVIVDDAGCAALDREQTEVIFRFAQETLRNVVHHANARQVTVLLDREGDDVIVEVSDDGVGFDPAIRPEGHFGLSLLTDLAREHGAELALRTAPGAGTTWRLRIPAGERA